jgi:hypothetical protein
MGRPMASTRDCLNRCVIVRSAGVEKLITEIVLCSKLAAEESILQMMNQTSFGRPGAIQHESNKSKSRGFDHNPDSLRCASL